MKLVRVSTESSVGADVEAGVVGELAQGGRGDVRRAFNRKKRFRKRALLRWNGRALGERRLIEKAFGDLRRAASADGGDPRNGEKVLDEPSRVPGVDFRQGRKDA